MAKHASPETVRRVCLYAGALGFSLFVVIALLELYTGTASVSRSKPLPNLNATRADDPSLYWSYFWSKLVIAGTISGCLMAFGQFIVWLNRRPGAPRTWEEE